MSDFIVANTEASIADMSTIDTKLDAGTLTPSDLNTIFGADNWLWYEADEQYVSDGLGHLEADGSGSGKSRNGATFSSAGSKRYNGAMPGADIATDGGFEDWASATDLTNWTETISGTSTVNRESTIVNSGTFSCRLDVDGSNSLVQVHQFHGEISAGDFVELSIWAKVDSITGNPTFQLTIGANTWVSPVLTTTWTQYTAIIQSPTTNPLISVKRNNAANRLLYFDDMTIKSYTLTDMFDHVETSTPDIVYRVDLTITDDTPGGIAVAWDSISNPQNGLVVYVDRAQDKLRVDKYLAGVFSSNLVDQAITYSAGAILEVHLSDANADGTYTLRTFYNRGNESKTTFSDADIINNTIHGLFDLVEGGFAEKENVWQKDYLTQYDKFYKGAEAGALPGFTTGFSLGFRSG